MSDNWAKHRFTLQQIRASLTEITAQNLPGEEAHLEFWPEYRSHLPHSSANATNAAVTILLYYNTNSKLCFPLIQRPSYQGYHSGQISLPGGKTEAHDKSIMDTAIRETSEELGIANCSIDVFAQLTKLYIPVSNFLVYPFIACLNSAPEFIPEKGEVERLIEIRVDEFLQCSPKTQPRDFDGKTYDIPYLPLHGEFVWGATSMILNEFLQILKKCKIIQIE